jgi:hypothetical protein
MEVVIGFVVGYWVGTRQGRQGLEKSIETVREIWESPETQRLLGQGLSGVRAASPLAGAIGQGKRNTRLAIIRDALDEFVERRYGRQASAA